VAEGFLMFKEVSGTFLRVQRGFLLMTAVVLIVVAALVLTVMVFLGVTGTESSVGHSQSGQALFVGGSGLEYEQRRLAQNVDWYRSTSDPMPGTTQALGAGSFTVYSNLPATMLRRRVVSGSTASICVYTIDRLPTSGNVQVGNDINAGGEFVQYTGTNSSLAACGNRPALTGITRNRTIGGIVGADGDHARGSNVYPVTTLITVLAASCAAPTTIQITDHSKFLNAGTITLTNNAGETEEIAYADSSRAGGVMTLTGVTRCQNGTGPFAFVANFPVTPLLDDGASPDFEAQMFATGSAGSATRQETRTIQR
jgi:hypothetical protein